MMVEIVNIIMIVPMKCASLLLRKFHGINLDGYDGFDRYERLDRYER
jgi:hypothetical protein